MAKAKAKAKENDVEPLSSFQDTSVTGRKDAAPKDKKKPAKGTPDVITKDKKKSGKVVEMPPPAAPTKKDQISIQRAKIFDDHHLTITYTKLAPDGTHSEHPGESYPERFMHADLRSKFKALAIHMALMQGYIPKSEIKSITRYNQDLVKTFTVTSVSIKAGEGVVITGHKKTDYKSVANFNTPFTRLGDPDTAAYGFVEDLQEKLDELVAEVIEYLEGTKVGEDPQGKLDFKEDGEEAPYTDEGL